MLSRRSFQILGGLKAKVKYLTDSVKGRVKRWNCQAVLVRVATSGGLGSRNMVKEGSQLCNHYLPYKECFTHSKKRGK